MANLPLVCQLGITKASTQLVLKQFALSGYTLVRIGVRKLNLAVHSAQYF